MAKVSVVIPAYNEEKSLAKILQMLKGQDCEVVVVDDKSKDNTVGVARSYGCKVVVSGRHNVPYSRNLGIKHASGSIIVSLDASEMSVPPDFIKEIKKNFKDCDGLMLREKCTRKTIPNRVAWLRSFYKYKDSRDSIKVFRKDDSIGFDENIDSFAEDFTVTGKIKRKKLCRTTYIETDMYPTWKSVYKSWRGYGRRSHFMTAPLFFWITSPAIAVHRFVKFRKWEAALIPVYDTIRSAGYVVGFLQRVSSKKR